MSSDLKSININLNPLAVAAGAYNDNAIHFARFMAQEPQAVLREAFEIMMCNSLQPNIEIVKTLLKLLADKNVPNMYGETPLMIAAQNGQTDTVRHLINSDADVNANSNNGDTSLMYAASIERRDIMQYLIKAHANVNARNRKGITSLIIASQNGHAEIVQDFIKADINANEQNN